MSGHHHGGGFRRQYYPGYQSAYPVVVETADSGCSCKAGSSGGSSLEAKIKENPLVFLVGALLTGWLLAKKR